VKQLTSLQKEQPKIKAVLSNKEKQIADLKKLVQQMKETAQVEQAK